MSRPDAGSLLQMTGIVKDFPGVRALDGVDLDVRAGEVHCLLGQNGAGKSTLIKVLSGFHQPDAGTIRWAGEETSLSSPAKAIERGVATIYQELDLVPHLDVTENVFLGHEVAVGGFTQRGRAHRRVRELLSRLGHPEISPTRLVGSLPPAAQQIVSMARALSHDTRLLVLDEPSAVLDQEEVANLFRVIRGLTAEGVAVVYISHRLEEIREIGDRITVLKDGRTVATGLPVADTPTAELIRLMTGRSIEYVFPPRPDARRPTPAPCSRSATSASPASSRASTSPCTPARSSASPGSSAPAAPRSSRPCTAPAGRRRAPSPSTASGCGAAR
jgi:ribose transport system ATP-binding protein